MQIQKIQSQQNFNGKVYTHNLNVIQSFAYKKVEPQLKELMKWKRWHLNINGGGTVIQTLNSSGKSTKIDNVYCFTKLQLENIVTLNIDKEKIFPLSPFQPQELVKAVKELINMDKIKK